MKFTAEQLSDWKQYEQVRVGGRHNMWTPQARVATGLNEERYFFTLKNYDALKQIVESCTANGPKPSGSKRGCACRAANTKAESSTKKTRTTRDTSAT